MCGTCGCSDGDNSVTLTNMQNGRHSHMHRAQILVDDKGHGHIHSHDHDHDHGHGHDHHHDGHTHSHGHDGHSHHHDHHHEHNHGMQTLEMAVLSVNDKQAEKNRIHFGEKHICALNLVSSPGAGKTSLLEATIAQLAEKRDIYVIEGDQMTANDAARIRKAGAHAIQVNTGAGCHLEADMVAKAVEELDLPENALLFVENVGNLVCPAMFDLGERMKVAIISTPEGTDKPLKYPHMFRASSVVIINKIDLAPYVDFDIEECHRNILEVNPNAKIISLSVKSGENMGEWLDFLAQQMAEKAAL